MSVTSFLTGVFVARTTGKPELGIYYLVLTLVFLARGVQSQVIFAPYVVYCHRRQGEASSIYAGSVLVHQVVMFGVVTAGLLAAWAGMRLFNVQSGVLDLLPLLAGAMPLLLLREFSRNIGLSHFRIAGVLLTDSFQFIIQFGGMGLLWHYHAISVPGVIGTMAFGCAASCAAWFLIWKQPWRFRPSEIAADWRENWKFAQWALAGHVVGSTTPQVMPWVLKLFRGEASVALLGACGQLVGVPNVFVMGLSNYVAPKAAQAFQAEGLPGLRRILAKASLIYFVVVGSFCLLSFVAGDWLVCLVYGNKYSGGGPVLAVLSVSVLAISMGIVAGNGLWAIDRPRPGFITDLACLIVTFAVGLPCIPRWDALGAAAAITLGIIVSAVLKWILLAKELRKLSNPVVH